MSAFPLSVSPLAGIACTPSVPAALAAPVVAHGVDGGECIPFRGHFAFYAADRSPELRSGYLSSSVALGGCLDAPVYLPVGSHVALVVDVLSPPYACSYGMGVLRGGTYVF